MDRCKPECILVCTSTCMCMCAYVCGRVLCVSCGCVGMLMWKGAVFASPWGCFAHVDLLFCACAYMRVSGRVAHTVGVVTVLHGSSILQVCSTHTDPLPSFAKACFKPRLVRLKDLPDTAPSFLFMYFCFSRFCQMHALGELPPPPELTSEANISAPALPPPLPPWCHRP